jgi:hypothetical protein
MRLHEQASKRAEVIESVKNRLNNMRIALDRKVRAPYGDGSTSDQVNANTDVFPEIEECLRLLNEAP